MAKLLRACGGCLGARRRKGVEDCDKPGGVAKRALIPGFPMLTQGTETSHYLEEEKEKSIPSVAASESGTAQTDRVFPVGVVGPLTWELPNHLLTERHGKAGQRW